MVKLTLVQLQEITPIVEAKNKADAKLLSAVRLIVGKEITTYSIQDGVINFTEPDKIDI